MLAPKKLTTHTHPHNQISDSAGIERTFLQFRPSFRLEKLYAAELGITQPRPRH